MKKIIQYLVLFLLMVCAMGFTVAAQSASLGASSPKTITGVVVSAFDKEPLKGVYVRLKGTNIGVATDIDGHFNIEAQLGDTLSVKVLDCDEIEVAVDAQQLRISLYNFVSGCCYGENLPQGVFGTVCNEDEKALQGATVTALPSGNCDITNSIGYFNITKIEDGDKSLRIEHPAYKTIQGRIDGNCYEIWLERNNVTGVVLSAEDGEPVIGARICAKGTKNGTASDFDGKFSISVTDGTVLTVSYPGLKPQEIVADSRQPMKVVLENDENDPFTGLICCPQPISVIRMDSLDFVLPESEFLLAQQHIDILKGDYYKLKNIEICRAKYLLASEIDKRKNNISIYGTPAMALSGYARQYIGFKHNGHRLVFINLTDKNIWSDGFDDFDKHLKTLIIRDAPQLNVRAIIDLDTEGFVFFSLGY
ncbi:MAG: carboxypeptidase-like regulatory domain-containing protein [Muribaculaceae bacterium]|nr:carboxypeptidase-like regulatory domain-containing protein [Muribaculaceae bacterium]